MKILIAHNEYRDRGGEDVVAEQEAEMLQARGHEVERLHASNRSASTTAWLTHLLSPEPRAKLVAAYVQLLRSKRPDLVHAHNLFPLIGPSLVEATRITRVPIVQTLHNYRPVCPVATHLSHGSLCTSCVDRGTRLMAVAKACYHWNPALSLGAARQSRWQFEALKSGAVRRGICLTSFQLQWHTQAGIPPERLALKPNMTADRGPGRGSGKYLLYVGRHSNEKGFGHLLAELRSQPATTDVVVVGSGPRDEELGQLRRDSGSRVQHLPFQSREDLAVLVADAAAVIMPSIWWEGLPMVALESLMAGTPILGSRLMRWVEGEPAWFVGAEVNTPGWLREAHSRLMDGDVSYQERRRAARQHYEANFHPDVNYHALLGIYQGALEEFQ